MQQALFSAFTAPSTLDLVVTTGHWLTTTLVVPSWYVWRSNIDASASCSIADCSHCVILPLNSAQLIAFVVLPQRCMRTTLANAEYYSLNSRYHYKTTKLLDPSSIRMLWSVLLASSWEISRFSQHANVIHFASKVGSYFDRKRAARFVYNLVPPADLSAWSDHNL